MERSSVVFKMIITVFFGFFGVHKFLEHKVGLGILYLCTLGLFGFGWIYDSIISVLDCVKVFQNTSNKSYYETTLEHTPHKILDSSALNNRDFDEMEGHEFEYFCADILRKNGYSNVDVTKGSGDQGIDIIAYKDGIKYGIQCKCYTSDIGNKAVQEAFSGKTFYNCHIAAVITNRYFTSSAKALAEKNGVLLWNRDKLEELINQAEY